MGREVKKVWVEVLRMRVLQWVGGVGREFLVFGLRFCAYLCNAD